MHIPITFPFSPMSSYSPIPIQNWVMGAHGGHVICVTRRDTTEHAVFRGGSTIRGKGKGGLLITSIVLSSFFLRSEWAAIWVD